ncbi:hypothetical protein F4810DRAFT_710326 [Camillea tinctor]|nr:hypothetical protein F4810DRAFT_710326 [Camillea tinctor]
MTPQESEGHHTITISIPSGTKYAAHTHLLVEYSKYFKKALKNDMEEARTRHFDLEIHATEETLSLFIDWLYKQDDEDSVVLSWVKDEKLSSEFLIRVWLFADYIQASNLQNDMISLLCSYYNSNQPDFGKRLEELLLWNPPSGSGLYRLMIKEIARGLSNMCITNEEREEWLRMLDRETLYAVTRTILQRDVDLANEYANNNINNVAPKYFNWSSTGKEFFEKTD